MDSEKKPEEYFFKYAFPCSQVLLQQRRISQEKYKNLMDMYNKGQTPDREVLESVFQAAFTRIKKLAVEMQRNYWDLSVIKEYWEKYHNQIIKQGEGMYGKAPESFKDLCRIHVAEVVEVKGEMMRVKYDGGGEGGDYGGSCGSDESGGRAGDKDENDKNEDHDKIERNRENEKKNERIVSNILVPDVKVGDKVRIHYGYAIERVVNLN